MVGGNFPNFFSYLRLQSREVWYGQPKTARFVVLPVELVVLVVLVVLETRVAPSGVN